MNIQQVFSLFLRSANGHLAVMKEIWPSFIFSHVIKYNMDCIIVMLYDMNETNHNKTRHFLLTKKNGDIPFI